MEGRGFILAILAKQVYPTSLSGDRKRSIYIERDFYVYIERDLYIYIERERGTDLYIERFI